MSIPDDKIKGVIFLLGDVIGMVVAWVHLEKDFFLTLWMTVLFGVIGGFCSMGGREIFFWIKEKIKNRNNEKSP